MAEGESVALLGPNGAGKSTFVGLLTRDIHPMHREEPPVRFRGMSRPLLEDVKMAIGYVSSSMQSQISVHLPAADVAAGGLFGSLGVPKRFTVTSEQRARVMEVMEQLGIADLADRDITTLSSGQARRVLIARAMVHNPSALIFDEPCTGLDPQGMFYVRKTMRQLAQLGCAVVLVTHYLEDIIPEINRVVLMKDAHIIADGSKEQLLSSKNMSALFGIPANVVQRAGYYSLMADY
ncbi:ATP-binding cassette domain-containing protein [Adlercreutzia sp. ZJ304]|uniref:ABC transporter ATP-binding protein n=1 Tax=Adlercreutzia sp. ZJ304 TaxID=2709791 RepID=UPI001F156A77|nr:ATP-binding cassette domain-containing protein [Adlercreutzia sp. ZJ304]